MVDNKLFLKKSIIENENITSEGILAYVGLVMMSENKIERLFTSLSAIEFALKVDFEKEDRYFKDKIKRGLLNLVDNGLINISSKNKDFKPNDVLAIRLINFIIDTKMEYFIIANITDIFKITRYEEKKFENDKLLRYYLVVVGTINNNSKIGYTPINVLSERSFISDRIIKAKYNPLLESMEILYINRSEISVKYSNGEIRKISNTYGRYKYKEEIIKLAHEFQNEVVGCNARISMDGNMARSIKQKYNNLIKKIDNGYIPTKEEIILMNNNIEVYNNKYKYDNAIIKLEMFKYTF